MIVLDNKELKDTYEELWEGVPAEHRELARYIYDNTKGMTDFSRFVFGLEAVGNYGTGHYKVFYKSGTFTPPTTGTYRIKVVGGGGGGNFIKWLYNGGEYCFSGTGGGGGGYASGEYQLTQGVEYSVVVARAVEAGINGESSSFSTLLSATGGQAGSDVGVELSATGTQSIYQVWGGRSGAGGTGIGGNIANYSGAGGVLLHAGGHSPGSEMGNSPTPKDGYITGALINGTLQTYASRAGQGLQGLTEVLNTTAQSGGGIRTAVKNNRPGGLFVQRTTGSIFGLFEYAGEQSMPTLAGLPTPFYFHRSTPAELLEVHNKYGLNGGLEYSYYTASNPFNVEQKTDGKLYPFTEKEIYGYFLGAGEYQYGINIDTSLYSKPTINIFNYYTNWYKTNNNLVALMDLAANTVNQLKHPEIPVGWGSGGYIIYNNADPRRNSANYGGGGATIDCNTTYVPDVRNSNYEPATGGVGGGGGASGLRYFRVSDGEGEHIYYYAGNGGIGAGGGGMPIGRDNYEDWNTTTFKVGIMPNTGKGGAGIVIIEW